MNFLKNKVKVNAVIAGFQKCGSTALHHFLSHHPDIIVSNPKEVHFFSTPNNYNKGFKYYHSFFKIPLFKNLSHKILIDSSPSYSSVLYQEFAIPKLYEYNPNLKIICLVRNPIDRAFSAWNMYKVRFQKDINWYKDLEMNMFGFIKSKVSRKEEEFFDFDLYVKNELNAIKNGQIIEASILPQGMYHIGIKNLMNLFSDILIIENEKMSESTPEYLNITTNFLGLKENDWSIFDEKKIFNQDYKQSLSEEIKSILSSFYLASDKELKRISGITYFN
jgi:hypothetical protein